LIQIDEIKQTFQESKDFLLGISESFGCYDRTILKMLMPENTLTSNITKNHKENTTFFQIYHSGFADMLDHVKSDTLLVTYMIVDIIYSATRVYKNKLGKNDGYDAFCRTDCGEYSRHIIEIFEKIDDLMDIATDLYGKIVEIIFNVMHIRTLISVTLLINLFYRILHLYHNYYNWNLSKKTGNRSVILNKKNALGKNSEKKNLKNSSITEAVLWKTDEYSTSCEIVNYVKMIIDSMNHFVGIRDYKYYLYNIISNEDDENSECETNIEHDEINAIEFEETTDTDDDLETICNILIRNQDSNIRNKDSNIRNKCSNIPKYISMSDVHQKLKKLFTPLKVPHYKYMYNLLLNDGAIYKNYGKNICPTISGCNQSDKIEYNVLRLKCKEPSQWFEYYGRNIGMSGKVDDYHMFPVSFDKILKTFPCVTRIFESGSDNKETNTLVYFYGKMINHGGGETIEGCYEYIINCRGTLYHRFFRSMNKIPEDVVLDIKKFMIK